MDFQTESKPKALSLLSEFENYAYFYTDQENGGIINIGFVKEIPKGIDDRLSEIYGDSSILKIYLVNYSEKQLKETAEFIFSKRNLFRDEGINISEVSVNIPEDKVDVYITPFNNEAIEKLNSTFPNEMITYKPSNSVHYTSRFDKLRPLQGGIEISATSNPSSCSTGFMAHDGTGSDYLVTAGHCAAIYDSVYQGGSYIGFVEGTNSGGTNDSAVIGIPSTIASKYVYGDVSQDTILTSVQGANEDNVGDPVCKAGITTGKTCGIITSTDVNIGFSGDEYTHIKSANFAVEGGDSGGAVYYGSKLMGVISASTGGGTGVPYTSYYSHASNILSYWGLSY